VHSARGTGTLTPDEMTKAWEATMRGYYGEEGEVYKPQTLNPKP